MGEPESHVVVIGPAAETIRELRESARSSTIFHVLTEVEARTQQSEPGVFVICGNPLDLPVLQQAGVGRARSVLISAESSTEQVSLVLAVLAISRSVRIVVDVASQAQGKLLFELKRQGILPDTVELLDFCQLAARVRTSATLHPHSGAAILSLLREQIQSANITAAGAGVSLSEFLADCAARGIQVLAVGSAEGVRSSIAHEGSLSEGTTVWYLSRSGVAGSDYLRNA